MSQRRKSRGHRNLGTATALTGVSGNAARAVPLHSVDTRIHSNDSTVWTRRRVLLLNSTFEPLTALSVRRAVVMVLCGKADAKSVQLGLRRGAAVALLARGERGLAAAADDVAAAGGTPLSCQRSSPFDWSAALVSAFLIVSTLSDEGRRSIEP